jgi:hypothetical protein
LISLAGAGTAGYYLRVRSVDFTKQAIMASENSHPPQNTVALGVGFGIGVLWWLMAGTAYWSAFRGYSNDRYDWGLAWALIASLLLAGGTAAMVGTWWHLTRVRDH